MEISRSQGQKFKGVFIKPLDYLWKTEEKKKNNNYISQNYKLGHLRFQDMWLRMDVN